ncbi:8-oxo-dGTP pyrophosphatase MutT (NUDIX family) [Paenochrobactrum gallinarii]|uniref:8-oxo-dGTP pyrophosphatase MutT (NUDIX family) n=1 Tax=Paenochrobactrum gallinarii TaxID=643673 RepID=A0A841LRH0_9HYPH|nr:NUDIX hydrolase [Paenochrobactrum gallinarii]MBB6259500.1 8-oxo-dGTP pyrophosphatase MutT (NUDIX family) [Paenochrobactrum gallinarii]
MNLLAPDSIATQKKNLLPNGRLQQVAALVWRVENGELQLLTITSRGTGRWVLPKGWPQTGRTLARTAMREAFEEAGIRGVIDPLPVGTYDYEKYDMPPDAISSFTVAVYAVAFTEQVDQWPERGERILEWVSPLQAAERVEEPELKKLILAFTPDTSPAMAKDEQ